MSDCCHTIRWKHAKVFPEIRAKYLARFKFSIWLLRNDGTSVALAKTYKPEELIPIAQNVENNFIHALGAGQRKISLPSKHLAEAEGNRGTELIEEPRDIFS